MGQHGFRLPEFLTAHRCRAHNRDVGGQHGFRLPEFRTAIRLVNTLFAAVGAADTLRFHAGLRDFPRVQEKKLLGYLRCNQNTQFGRRHRFDRIASVEAYQKSVPLADYEEVRPWVERIAAGEKRVLTAEEVLLLEPTGGSRSGSKWIPYTRSLKREFQAAVHAWVFDLFRAFPGLSGTKSYWSVTPVTSKKQTTAAGIPVGFEDDTDYLGLLGGLLRRVFPVPGEIRHLRSMENFRYLTAFHLLRARDLGLISVWNPTFLLLLVDCLEEQRERLVRDLFDGVVRLPRPEEDRFAAPGKRHWHPGAPSRPAQDLCAAPDIRPSPSRARSVETAFASSGNRRYRDIWPELRVISCWADGISASYAEQAAALFPGVHLQPKGLLATEGVVSFPLAGAAGGVVAYCSHFYEFLQDGDESPRLLHQLEPGGRYTVAITTGGGLYRYHLGDRVEVVGNHRGLPAIRFCGRSHVSDLVGEKLAETHVQDAVQGVLRAQGVSFTFLLFAPERKTACGYYALFIEPGSELPPALQDQVLRQIDRRLMENVHYQYARELGQLVRPACVVLAPKLGQQAYLRRCLESGQRLGDIKQTLLDHRTGWTDWFARSAGQDKRGSPGPVKPVEPATAEKTEASDRG